MHLTRKNSVLVNFLLIFAPNRAALDNFIFKLKQEFDLTAEDSIEDYLGVRVSFNKQHNTVTLSQTGLIDKILSTVFPDAGEYVKPHYTPAVDLPLSRLRQVLRHSSGSDS